MMTPGAIFELKIHQNAYAAGASPRTTLEKLTRAPRPHTWFSLFREPLRSRGGEERGGNEEQGRGSIPPLFLNNLTTAQQ